MALLEWDEVEPSANENLNVWSSGSELQWAQTAWKRLEDAGLTAYDGLRDYHLIAARFLSLCRFYLDWASFYDGPHDGTLYWVSRPNDDDLDRFYLGQLLPDEDNIEESLESSIEIDALEILIQRERDVIAPVLIQAADGTDNLFKELKASTRPTIIPKETVSTETEEVKPFDEEQPSLNFDEDEDDENEEEEGDFEPTPENLAAYDWVRSGCP